MAQTVAMPVAHSRSLSHLKFDKIQSSLSQHSFSATYSRSQCVEIPSNKRIEYSLQYIHGIGRTRARQILVDLQMENKITKDMAEEELIILRDEVSKYMIEGDLRRFNALAVKRLKEIQCSCSQEIEGDSMLPWRKAHPRIAVSGTEDIEQLQDS